MEDSHLKFLIIYRILFINNRKVEYFMGIQKQIRKMRNNARIISDSIDSTDIYMSEIQERFTDIKSILSTKKRNKK